MFLAMAFVRPALLFCLLWSWLASAGVSGGKDASFPDYPIELLVERAARWKLLGFVCIKAQHRE